MQISREYFQLMHPRENINIKLVFSKIDPAIMGFYPRKIIPLEIKLSFGLSHENKNGTHGSTSEKGEVPIRNLAQPLHSRWFHLVYLCLSCHFCNFLEYAIAKKTML